MDLKLCSRGSVYLLIFFYLKLLFFIIYYDGYLFMSTGCLVALESFERNFTNYRAWSCLRVCDIWTRVPRKSLQSLK